MTPEEILAKAAEDIAAHGHAKEKFYSSSDAQSWETASACALGAIARITGHVSGLYDAAYVRGDILVSEAVRKLAATIRAKDDRYACSDNYSTITGYNDDDRTTAEDMILTMKEAANG